MYDPTDNSGGHQPIGHDQMMAFHEHLIGNSPTERVHYGIFVIPAFSSDNVNVLTDIVLNCDTIYYEPKKIPIS